MVSFAVQKLLSLIRSHLFIFITLGSGSKKSLLPFTSEYSVFSSKSFIVSNHTFGSVMNFEFIFVYGVKECSNFNPLHVTVWFCQHHLLKRLSSLHCIFFLCQRLSDSSILFYSFVV